MDPHQIQPDISKERLDSMVDEFAAASGGATETPSPAPEAEEPATESAPQEGEAEGGQPPKADPSKLISELQQKVKELESREQNLGAMQQASHQRNAQAREERRIADQALEQARAANSRAESLLNAIATVANSSDPELFRQIVTQFQQDRVSLPTTGTGAQGVSRQADPELQAVKDQLAELQKSVGGFAFNVNYGALAAAVERQVAQQPIFQKLERMGELDGAVQSIIQTLVQKDQEEPGSVNPHNPRALSDIVRATVKAEAERWQKRRDGFVKDYREEKRATSAKAPATAKGPSASVRASQPPSSQPLPESMATKDKIKKWTEDFIRVSKRPTNGVASEI